MDEYIVSARKYRPTSFDTVVGQTALTTTLKSAVKSGKLAHAYLFCGPRGVGKTTCARIFAKAINCQNPTAEGEACNECESCKSFNEQRSYNIFELDAASNNSVENIKALMEQTRIPPQVGKYKVFIIDEVHMLSSQAFNAFLKTLEEPPSHVIFILATTEKHKILPTILSRCQIYDFERMSVANTIAHLKNVAEKEGIKYEEEALNIIAKKADGGMRDALSIFDQAASFCQGNITYQKVIEDLNVLDTENYFNIINLSLENKVSEIMVLLNNIINKGFDGGLLINGLASHVRNVLMAKDEQTLSLLETSEQQKRLYKEQAQKCKPQFLYQALKILNQCDVNYKQSSNKRLLVELTLIEVAQITQPDDNGVGRRPRRLKTLFKNLILTTQPDKADKQVSAVEQKNQHTKSDIPHISVADKLASKTDESAVATSDTNTYKRSTRLRLKNKSETTSLSWDGLRSSSTQNGIASPVIQDASSVNQETETNKEFTQEELSLEWIAMCNRMAENRQELNAIATRMKNMIPHITTFPNIEVTAENQIIKNDIERIRGGILATLKLYLKNNKITMSIVVSEHEEVKVLTRKEQFAEMAKNNPSIERLRQLMGLELA